jgi:hypothetical protein
MLWLIALINLGEDLSENAFEAIGFILFVDLS